MAIPTVDKALENTLLGLNVKPQNVTDKINISTLPQRIAHMVNSGGGVTVFDLERFIGDNDLVKINYLQRGLTAARSVCRIFVGDMVGSGGCWGTGFLISPNLLITNHHVLESEEDARNAFAEFEYEADETGVLKQGKRFKMRPDLAFLTSKTEELDFTIVALENVSDDNITPLQQYGFLRLNPDRHKVIESEFVTIIQHPNGDQKYVALRENKVVKIGDKDNAFKDHFIWYTSDTAKGSSGAPTFNDSWQVVAIHHKGVPMTRDNNGFIECQLIDGTWMKLEDAEKLEEDKVKYVANEGVRISAIVTATITLFNALPVEDKIKFGYIKELLDDAMGVKAFPNTLVKASINNPLTESAMVLAVDLEAKKTGGKNIRPISYYQGRKGYDDNFLNVAIPLPELTEKAKAFGSVPRTIDTGEDILKYTHFSIKYNADRKIAFYTAVNIDGTKWRNLKRGVDKWFYDPRIPLEIQVDDALYAQEPADLGTKGWFDRGHLVRRQDPDWGTMQVAALADDDTFHWANCSPQYWGFNQGQELWAGLENYILYNTDQEKIKAIVYSGPVFSNDDEEHRGVLIPQYFWKVVVVNDSAGNLYSSAYVVSQKQYATNIPFEEIPVHDFNHFQVKMSKIEQLTGLSFAAAIRQSDVLAHDVADQKGLRSFGDINIPRRK